MTNPGQYQKASMMTTTPTRALVLASYSDDMAPGAQARDSHGAKENI